MSALEDALLHSANAPLQLVQRLAELVNSSVDFRILAKGSGVICDFRPGWEEENASLSVSMGNQGAVFKRHSGDGFEGGAVAFVSSCLNVPKQEAVQLLIDWAGLPDTPTAGNRPISMTGESVLRPQSKRESRLPLGNQDAQQRLRGWVRIKEVERTPEAIELDRRGLTPALADGLLVAYRFIGRTETGKRVALPGHILQGAVAFEVRGSDGKLLAIKARNPGSKEELKAAKGQRYVYLGKGQGTPAWCSPALSEMDLHLVIEGEFNGVASALAIRAAGHGDEVAVQGVAGANASPDVSSSKAGARVHFYADPDAAGDNARQNWATLLESRGAKVHQLPRDLFGGGDACDALSSMTAAEMGTRIMEAMNAAPLWVHPAETNKDSEQNEDVWVSKREGFGLRHGVMCALSLKRGEDSQESYEVVEELCNFTAVITAEVIEEDGTGESPRIFEIDGWRADGRPMYPARVKVTVTDFATMNWPVREWGAQAIVRNGQGKKDKAREAIQRLSEKRGVTQRIVYKHSGWIQHPEHGPLYLTTDAVIGAAGAVEGVEVNLPGRLSAYALPAPGEGEVARQAVRASLALLKLAPDSVGVPVLGAVYRAPLGRIDTAVWANGETGRNKTAYLTLAQAHYGPNWTRQHLPDGWNSSANALEMNSFVVKDAVFLIDDFKPSGGTAELARAHASVGRIFQGLADGQGRGTLTADRRQRPALYPRGLIMSSSETLPRGHSNRARAVIVEVNRPLIGKSRERSDDFYAAEAQAGEGVYALAMAGYVQFIAAQFKTVAVGSPAHKAQVRELAPHFEGAHGRTGNAAAELAYGWKVWLSYAVALGAVSDGEAKALWERVVLALKDTAQGQATHLTAEDPVPRALAVLSSLLAQGRVYLEDRKSGGQPKTDPELYGWEVVPRKGSYGEDLSEWRTKPSAGKLGWHERDGGDDWAYLLPDAVHEALQRAVAGQGGALLPDLGTLLANMRDRLREAGLMRCEPVKNSEGVIASYRPLHKATANGLSGQQRLIVLRLPLNHDLHTSGINGLDGIEGENKSSSTVFVPIPSTSLIKKEDGINGIENEPVSSLTGSSAPPQASSGVLEDPVEQEMDV